MNTGVTRRNDVHSDTFSEDHKVFDTEMEEHDSQNNCRQCCNQPTMSLQLKKKIVKSESVVQLVIGECIQETFFYKYESQAKARKLKKKN